MLTRWDVPLPRWVAIWSDGIERLIHARTKGAATDLAYHLTVPEGVRLVRVELL